MYKYNPVVSVVLTSYNHRKYIAEAIESILNQSYERLEVIIVDDGSRDGSADVISKFRDPRIKFLQIPNLGPSEAMNAGVLESKGEYVALMTSDDRSAKQRIEKQMAVISEKGPDTVVFTWVTLIGEKGKRIYSREIDSGTVFNVANRSRGEILKWFFLKGNFLCGPSVLINRENLLKLSSNGSINSQYLYQLQDLHLWIRLVSRYEFYIVEEPLFEFRMHGNNLSEITREKFNALKTESFLIFDEFLAEIPDDIFNETFLPMLPGNQTKPIARPIAEAALLLNSNQSYHRLLGIQRFFKLSKNPLLAKTFEERFGIDQRVMRKLLTTCKIFGYSALRLEGTKFINRARRALERLRV